MTPVFVSINGKNTNLFFVRHYVANPDGSVRVQIEREPAANVLKGDEAAAFLAAVGDKPATPTPPAAPPAGPAAPPAPQGPQAGLKEKVPDAPTPTPAAK